MPNLFNFCVAVIFAGLLFSVSAAQSGGQFVIEHSVIAAGGASSSGGSFKIEGTVGQTVAGQKATAMPFSLHAGFWNAEQFIPTAAAVSVGGRVMTADGRGIRNVLVTMTTASGETRTILSGASGYFRFAEVSAGETYVFSALAKRYRFTEPLLVRTILEDTEEINFVAVENP